MDYKRKQPISENYHNGFNTKKLKTCDIVDDYRNCEMSPNCDVDKSKVDLSKELIPEQIEHNNEPSDESSVTLNNDLVRKTQQYVDKMANVLSSNCDPARDASTSYDWYDEFVAPKEDSFISSTLTCKYNKIVLDNGEIKIKKRKCRAHIVEYYYRNNTNSDINSSAQNNYDFARKKQKLFYSFFKSLVGKDVVVELKNDLSICGTLHSVDQYLNIKLVDISVTDPEKYPHMASVRNCFIRGSVVRYVQLPADEVDTQLLQDAARKEATVTR
ncbi:uncharacterized protein LOC114126984 isoform X1 [Aphis gossypii]|uniref:uncharacterized protein LOC114126984 isoform X1 n=1 Tax=Aphis gossypii TaxID=80765 RepID=UPI002158C144|nr:uncharacterized protein LOC114126984 isoform X1 [Aphis gossypii]